MKHTLWQIARTIYQIVLQIFIPLGVPQAHGELLRKCRAIWQRVCFISVERKKIINR
ncbi:MAG: hypothetical protein V9G20_16225 [Candidatus Promineifilaceae bacterium]